MSEMLRRIGTPEQSSHSDLKGLLLVLYPVANLCAVMPTIYHPSNILVGNSSFPPLGGDVEALSITRQQTNCAKPTPLGYAQGRADRHTGRQGVRGLCSGYVPGNGVLGKNMFL